MIRYLTYSDAFSTMDIGSSSSNPLGEVYRDYIDYIDCINCEYCGSLLALDDAADDGACSHCGGPINIGEIYG